MTHPDLVARIAAAKDLYAKATPEPWDSSETTTSVRKCRWWNRWYHRRLRRIDREFMSPALESLHGACGSTEESLRFVAKAWNLFMSDVGQEHWRCECAMAELAAHDAAGGV